MDSSPEATRSAWGLTRLVVVSVVALTTVVIYGDGLSPVHYLPFVLGVVYALLVVLGRPWLVSSLLLEAVVDAALIAWVVLATGGRSSPWILLYMLASFGLMRTSWVGRGRLITAVASGAVLLVSFLLSAMATDVGYGSNSGSQPRLEPSAVTFDLRVEPYALAVFVVAIGAVAAAFGIIYRRGEDARVHAEKVATRESNFSELATTMVQRFGERQKGLNEQLILDTVVRSVVWDLGYSYARAESFDEESGEVARFQVASRAASKDDHKQDEYHPLVYHSNNTSNTMGRLVVRQEGERGVEERALRILTAHSAEALASVRTSPGGRDAVTDLPNRRSLRQTLQRNVAHEPRISLLVAEIEGLDNIDAAYGPGTTEAALVEVAKALENDFNEVYCLSEELYVVVPNPRPATRAMTREEADSVKYIVTEAIGAVLDRVSAAEEAGVGEAPYDCSVGFAEASGNYSAEGLLRGMGPALEAARRDPDGIGGPGQLWRWRSVDSLLAAIAAWEPGLYRHLYGTADLARRIGERMDLAEAELDLEGLEVGALLHDSGKWTVRPEVAHGDLSQMEEWERGQYEEIPERGYTLLHDRGEQDLPQSVYVSVLTHCERYDGCGYPSKFAATDIPLSGRITAVADAMDEFLRCRLEQPDSPHTIAEKLCESGEREVMTNLRNMLTAGRGTAFDPVVVDTALSVADEIEAKADMIG